MRELLDSLRTAAGRPLAMDARRRLAAICIAAMVAFTGVLFMVRPDAGGPALDAARPEIVGGADAVPSPTPEPVAEEAEGAVAGKREITVAKRAARGFLDTYLPYANGRGDAAQLRNVTEELRRELAERPPRPASTWDPDRPPPRVEHMQVTGTAPGALTILVLAVDGDLPISFELELELELELGRDRGAWLVAGLGA